MCAGRLGRDPSASERIVPPAIRGTFPGFTYQFGNLLASANATIQSAIADHMDHNYSWALAGVAGIVAVVIAVLVGLGREARDVHMGGGTAPAAASATGN